MASKIEEYGLSEIAIQLFREGLSYGKVAKALNEQLPEGEEPISVMAVHRWRKAGDNEEKIRSLILADENNSVSADVAQDEAVNPYVETCKLVEDCDVQIDTVKSRLKALSKVKVGSKLENENITLLATLIGRKQSLLKDVAIYQKDMASYNSVRQMMKVMVEVIKQENPDAYKRFKERIANEVAFQAMLK